MKFKTIEWRGDCVRLLDQRALPRRACYIVCKDASSVAEAIQKMAIRGAPAIGVAAAMGVALAAKRSRTLRPALFRQEMERVCERMRQTRPTAVNLFWALDRMKKVWDQRLNFDVEEMKERLEAEAIRIFEEDREVNQKIGENGKVLIHEGDGVLTHCNAGGLATAGYGTALGVIYAAWTEGKRFRVFVDETRPLLQGSRLTAWELSREGIPTTILTDNMAGWLMSKREVTLVLVGADRIARNGDTANKIGTYGLAVLSKWHGIPFYVAAPTSTLDLSLVSGKGIPVEEREPEEVTRFAGVRVAPKACRAINPAFDITPHSLIHGIITEKGIIRRPFGKRLKRMKEE
ncbi:MAG: S-methyl-5-thioribose-1-phosphate isomerase [Syntrophaceae bacterium]|nr:S-methyl-5-thioribose-1-phosphate isomerase [Syntrophaceae bacterium]